MQKIYFLKHDFLSKKIECFGKLSAVEKFFATSDGSGDKLKKTFDFNHTVYGDSEILDIPD